MNKYGLIGSNVTFSYSKKIHETFYAKNNLNAQYDLISISSDKLEETVNKLRTKEYLGFNVTIPYKQEVLQYVDIKTDSVLETSCCNTLILIEDKIVAYNTDVFGFDYLIDFYNIELNETFILGDGATTNSIESVLNKRNVKYQVISRKDDVFNINYLEQNISNQTIINATPVGMYPNIESLLTEDAAKKAKQIIDIIYNPKETLLMSYNKCSYNGLVMLIYQAVKAFEIWTKINVDIEEVKKIIDEFEVK